MELAAMELVERWSWQRWSWRRGEAGGDGAAAGGDGAGGDGAPSDHASRGLTHMTDDGVADSNDDLANYLPCPFFGLSGRDLFLPGRGPIGDLATLYF